MLLKCCIQYVSKFGKISSGLWTGIHQFSFQSPRKAMLKNVQTIAQLHASHTLAKQCSKFSKPGFSNTWTENFQMFKLVLEKGEEPEIKLPTSIRSLKKQKSSRKTSISALLTIPKPLTVWITTNCGTELGTPELGTPSLNWNRDGNTRLPDLPPEKPVGRSRSNSSNQTWNNGQVPHWERSTSRLYIVTLLI